MENVQERNSNLPLVSILIPTYNRVDYLELALLSAINQTYDNIEIIISDNSNNDETENLLNDKYLNKYSNIKYYKNKINIGASESTIKLLGLANGEYINYLMDDDIFEETKIEKMMKYFLEDKDNKISMITSTRRIINGNGLKMHIFYNLPTEDDEVYYKGQDLIDIVLALGVNIIGEPTTVLFKRSKLKERFGVFKGHLYISYMDLAVWFSLLLEGDCVFIKEPLSQFRIHGNQGGANKSLQALGFVEWKRFIDTFNDLKNK